MYRPRFIIAALVAALGAIVAPSALPAPASPQAAELPIFVVAGPGASAEAAAKLERALGLRGNPHQEDGSLRYVDPERLHALPTADTGERGKDENGRETVTRRFDFEAIKGLDVLSDGEALRRSAAALREAGLHPAGAKASIGHSRFEAVDLDGRSVVDKAIDTQVSYSFQLQGRPLVGPGARVNLAFDGTGAVTDLTYALRDVKPGRLARLISQAEADRRARDAYQAECGPKLDLRLRSEIVYYAPPLSLRSVDALYPHFRYSATTDVDGRELRLRDVLIPAVEGAPTVDLSVSASGRTLVGDASVRGGNGPYAISYRSCGNDRGSAAALRGSKVRFSAPAAKQRALDGLTVVVTDRNGLTAKASKLVRLPATRSVQNVGAESISACGGLTNAAANADGYVNRFAAEGIGVSFNWHELAAWEDDFKDNSLGGNDAAYADSVDQVFYTGHANGDGFQFCSSVDDTFLHFNDAKWGNNYNLEWLVVAACGPLQDDSSGQRWWQRWDQAFAGLHMILAYENVSWDVSNEGSKFAEYQLRTPSWWNWFQGPMKVRNAWVTAAKEAQGDSSVRYAVMGVYGSDGATNYDDYYWGKGTVTGDIYSPTGYWKISGPAG
jgi:hypothetical protein